ncbi:hypothetical protein ACYB9R_02020 [Alcaligenes aquatilis]|nr:hypothetical protein [Alcaligenes faecalis]
MRVVTVTNSAIVALDNNHLTRSSIDKVKACLSGKTCSSEEQKKASKQEAERLSQFLDQEMNAICAANPIGDACRTAVNTATQYIAMQAAWI